MSQIAFRKAHNLIAHPLWGISLLCVVTALSWYHTVPTPDVTKDFLQTAIMLLLLGNLSRSGFQSLFFITLPKSNSPFDRNLRPTQKLKAYLAGSLLLTLFTCFGLMQIYGLFWWSMATSLLSTYIYHACFSQKILTRFFVRKVIPLRVKNLIISKNWGENLLRDLQSAGSYQPRATAQISTMMMASIFLFEIYLLHFVSFPF